MKDNIYEKIIQNSRIAYLKIDCIKNEKNKYNKVKVIEQSKEFQALVKKATGNHLLNIETTEYLINNWILYEFKENEFDLFIRDIIKNEYTQIEYPLELKNKKFLVDIYYIQGYFILIYNLSCNKANNKEKIKIYSWFKNLEGRYTEVYEGYLDSNHKKRVHSIEGKLDTELWRKNELKLFRENQNEVIRKKNVKTFYHTIEDGGEKYYLESTIWPVLNEEKNIIGFRGTGLEISDKLALEKTIEQNEENFKEITKYSESIFIICDLKRAIYVSPAYKNVFEEEADEIYMDISKLYKYFKKGNSELEDLEVYFKMNNSYEGVAKIILDNNKEKCIWYKFLPIKDSKGNVYKRVGILTDVTERKKLEEGNNQLKLDFFANLSHELRTPINLISSTIQLTKLYLNNLPRKDEEKINQYMNMMEINTFRLVRLVNNLLDSTRIDAGYIDFKPVNADIIRFVEDICGSVVEFVRYNKMNLVFDTNIEEDIILFDPEIIERIVLNILSNAIKFNKPEACIYVNIESYDQKIRISIKDEGIGIPNEKLISIFDRFTQVDSKDRIEKQGSGIGLYLVKSLVELHSGTIEINSKVNEGSEFIITIPKNKSSENKKYIINNNDIRYANINIEFADI